MADPLAPASPLSSTDFKPDPAAMSPGGVTSAKVVSGLKETMSDADKLSKETEKVRSYGQEVLAKERHEQDQTRHENELKRLALMGNQPVAPEPKDSPQYDPMDPIKAWASPAMMIAMFGSLLTRTPMISAMNAASETLKAFKQNDVDKYNQSYREWQTETTNAEKMFEHQQSMYAKLLTEADRHENETDTHYSRRIADIERELGFLNISLNHERMNVVLKEQGWRGIEQVLANEKSFFARMESAQKAIVDGETERVAQMALYNDPNFIKANAVLSNPNATPEEKTSAASTISSMIVKSMPSFAAKVLPEKAKMVENASKEIFEQNPVGKEYRYLQSADVQNTLKNALNELKTKHMIEPYTAAALKEAFTKSSTGGQAIRGFMVKLIQDQYPYNDVAQSMFNRFWQTGGGLDDNQGKLLTKIVNQYIKNNALATATIINDKAKTLEPLLGEEVANSIRNLDSSLAGLVNTIQEQKSGGPTTSKKPPQSAIKALKENPGRLHDFAQHYGMTDDQSRAYLGGPTGRSDTFRPVADARPILSQLFPGIHINREYSSPNDPTGYPSDWHHKSHAAVDVRPSSVPGMTFNGFIKKIEDAGYHIIEKRDEVTNPSGRSTGPHWHVVIGDKNG